MAKLHHKGYRLFLFWTGIIATLAYRIIIILNHYSDIWVEIAWYVGTIGFTIYFIHRYNIESKRDKMIERTKLLSKVKKCQGLSKTDRQNINYVLKSLSSSQAKWNYFAIFLLSALALAYDLSIKFIAIFN